jgi:hypothetical protein
MQMYSIIVPGTHRVGGWTVSRDVLDSLEEKKNLAVPEFEPRIIQLIA